MFYRSIVVTSIAHLLCHFEEIVIVRDVERHVAIKVWTACVSIEIVARVDRGVDLPSIKSIFWFFNENNFMMTWIKRFGQFSPIKSGNLEVSSPQAMRNSVRKESFSLPPLTLFRMAWGFQIAFAVPIYTYLNRSTTDLYALYFGSFVEIVGFDGIFSGLLPEYYISFGKLFLW